MELAIFCAAILPQCVLMGSNQNGPVIVLTIYLIKYLPGLVSTLLSLFPVIPRRLLTSLSGHIFR